MCGVFAIVCAQGLPDGVCTMASLPRVSLLPVVVFAAVAILTQGLSRDTVAVRETVVYKLGEHFLLTTRSDGTSWKFDVSPSLDPKRILWQTTTTPGSPALTLGAGNISFEENSGNFFVDDARAKRVTTAQTVQNVTASGCKNNVCSRVTVKGTLLDEKKNVFADYQWAFLPGPAATGSKGFIDFFISFVPSPAGMQAGVNRMYISWGMQWLDNFYGLGEQYTIHGLRKQLAPVFSTEQGIGRGLQPLSTIIDVGSKLHNAAGNWHTTYTAIPHYISKSLCSVFVNDTRYMEFDFGKKESGLLEVMLLLNATGSHQAVLGTHAKILYGNTPKDIIEVHTSYAGRMAPLPDWVNEGGAVVGWEGGTAAARSFLRQLRANNVSVAGLWLQDWTGLRVDPFGKRLWWNWELDEDWYPGWSDLVKEVRALNDARMTTYVNPYLASTIAEEKKKYRRNLWLEAANLGYLIKNSSGQPYIQSSASRHFTFSTVDLTNPAATTWFKRVLRCNMLGDQSGCDGNATAVEGASGWMSDFGEYVPFDAVLYSGEPAETVHNKFPELWAKCAHDAVEEAGRTGDVTFWSRSASARSPSYSTLFWAGDQLTSWDEKDGMQSAFRAILSGGLSGMSLAHSDTGGYTEVAMAGVRWLRTDNLLMRWTEMESFTGAMLRTHPGLLPDKSAQVNSSAVLLRHFGFFSKVHALIAPYRTLLMEEAYEKGYPLARYMFLEFPKMLGIWDIADQFMLGSEFLVAPVFDKSDTFKMVVLPVGNWTHVWTGTVHQGTGAPSRVDAPYGEPPVFLWTMPPGEETTINKVAMSVQTKLMALFKQHNQ